jgi:hypothetical protein
MEIFFGGFMKNIYSKIGSIVLVFGLIFFGCDLFSNNDEDVDYGPLQMPNNVRATANSTTSITVSWNPVENATGYHIYRNLKLSGPYDLIESTTATSYTDTELSGNTLYYYQIAAYNKKYVGPRSRVGEAKTNALPPHPPYDKKVAIVSNSITISWSMLSYFDADGYKIYKSLNELGDYIEIGSTSSNSLCSYKDTGLSPNTTYYYKVTSYHKSTGESPLADTESISATTQNIDTGRSWETAIEIPISTIWSRYPTRGDFPEGWEGIWYTFTRDGPGTLFANDYKTFSYHYTGDIVVDILFMHDSELYYAVLENNTILENIDIGAGYTDLRNIRVSNWNGTFYVFVRPLLGEDRYKGTFELFFVDYISYFP